MGGVASGQDALELVLAGSSAISVGTATFGNPTAAISIRNQLRELCIERGFSSFQEVVGYAHRLDGQEYARE
jgi:dihydroorotate dehydrogenase (NAD+) catalytic subunit